ncbi:aspartate kinase [Numidum massiliense]|uniref:aspartate kinase n=1 Tax=Numidum massiliense TaxID=1522315 RepID=UPI0006D5B1AB|nr:aspartate kinase [Numidum massiliense]
MRVIVQKFGGTSLRSPERVRHAAGIVAREVSEGQRVVVVVSAMGDDTDQLMEKAKQLRSCPPPRELDMLLATGEQVSMALFAMALQQLGIGAVSLTGWQAGIVTDAVHTEAEIREVAKERIYARLAEGNVVIVAGFQGVTEDGEITTLGRGGSDTTAVALAAALAAERCDIFTDVDGVFTADPRIVPSAQKLACVGYDEMLTMAHFGANVLHARAVNFAKKYRVPLSVRSSFHDGAGTRIGEGGSRVCGVACKGPLAKITFGDVADLPSVRTLRAHLLAALPRLSVPDDTLLVGGGAKELTVCIGAEHLPRALEILEGERELLRNAKARYEQGWAQVSLIGAGLCDCDRDQVRADVLRCVRSVHGDAELFSATDLSISCIVPEESVQEAAGALHRTFGLERVAEEKVAIV